MERASKMPSSYLYNQ
ncbi:hypothetical protein KVP95_13540 [Escherichia coli]|nr:hypothetical protein [Escherichia coli]MCH0681797.1 hypothetical protein [Escherichia coli]UZR91978.1 hypothetical protein ORI33_18265 [Escherichia coli]